MRLTSYDAAVSFHSRVPKLALSRKYSPNIPECYKTGCMVAVLLAIAAAVKRPAANACINIAPKYGIWCSPMVVKIDVLHTAMQE